MVCLEADIEVETYTKLPDVCHKTRSQGGVLKKALYGLAQAGLLWSKIIWTELEANGFEHF